MNDPGYSRKVFTVSTEPAFIAFVSNPRYQMIMRKAPRVGVPFSQNFYKSMLDIVHGFGFVTTAIASKVAAY